MSALAKPAFPAASDLEEMDKRRVRAWLDAIRTRYRVEIPEIARRSGVSPSTIYRWLDDDVMFSPSRRAIKKIATAFGTAMPDEDEERFTGFAEGEMSQMPLEGLPAGIRAVGNQGVWKLNTRALELIGYLPGDLLLVDLIEPPRPGDIVCAQIYDFQRGTAETKLRLFEPPYLTTRSMDPAASEAPIYIDNQRAVVMGVVVRSLRERRGA